jgi:tetratricopeptide (TPR) repeat protein
MKQNLLNKLEQKLASSIPLHSIETKVHQVLLPHKFQKETISSRESIKTSTKQLPNEQEEYQALINAIAWTDGFASIFVRCSPAKGDEIIQRMKQELPQKNIEVLSLKEGITDNLYDFINNSDHYSQANVLFITGIERLLYEYEAQYTETKFKDIKERYSYSWKGVPPILKHLNQQRENFRDHFKICFVFLLPLFALKYFIRRAPDFFDWRAGVIEFVPSSDFLRQESVRIVLGTDYKKYLILTPNERQKEIGRIQSILTENNLTPQRKAELLIKQGSLYNANNNYELASKRYEEAITHCNQVISLNPESYEAWRDKSSALIGLRQYSEAVASCDKAIQSIANNYQAWNNKGEALSYLNRYEEALISIENAIKGVPKSDERKDDYELLNSKGVILYYLGRYEEALESFQKVITGKPDYDSAWQNQGFTLYDLGRYEEAKVNFKKALSIYDKTLEANPNVTDILNSKGIVLSQLGDHETAIANFDKVVELNPNIPYVWENRGQALLELGRYKEALKSYEKVFSNDEITKKWSPKDNVNALIGQANILAYLNRNEDALRMFDEAIKIQPNNPDVWYSWGNILVNLERYEEAINIFNKALELKPDYYWALLGLGDVLRNLDRAQEADESYHKAIECKPKEPEFWNNWGEILYYNRDLNEEALASFEKAIKLNKPGYYLPFYNRGNVLSYLNRYKEAIADYDKVTELKPEHYWAWYYRGDALRQLNRDEDARASYLKAFDECQSDDADFFQNLGKTLYDMNLYNEALACFDKELALRHDNYDWVMRSVTLRELGRTQEAVDECDKAVAYQPDDDDAWAARGVLLSSLDFNEEGIKSLKQALEIKPNSHEIWNALGDVLNKIDHYEEAINCYNQAIAYKDDEPVYLINRGKSLFKIKQYQTAISSFDRAIILSPNDSQIWNERGDAFYQLERYQEAVESYDKALACKSPDNHLISWHERSYAMLWLGNNWKAIASFNKWLYVNFKQEVKTKNLRNIFLILIVNLIYWFGYHGLVGIMFISRFFTFIAKTVWKWKKAFPYTRNQHKVDENSP